MIKTATQRIFSFTTLLALLLTSLLPGIAAAQTVVLSPNINFIEVTNNPFNPDVETTTFRWELQNSVANMAFYIYDPSVSRTTPIRILSYSASHIQGVHTVTWFGDYENKTKVPAGTYEFEISYWNPTTGLSDLYRGNVTVAYAPVNNNAPVITNDQANPLAINPDNNETTTISWNTDMQARTTVEILDGSNGLVKTLINQNNQTGGSVTWNGTRDSGTKVIDGSYTYKITACNPAATNLCDTETGLITVRRATVVAPVISNVYLSDYNLNPPSETTTLYWTTNMTSNVTVEVRDSANNLERTFLDNASRNAGADSIVWNGNDRYGVQVPNGSYTFTIKSCNPANLSLCDTETISLTVNTGSTGSMPVITNDYATPNPFDPDTETTRIYFTLDKTADVTVEIWDGSTRVETLVDDVSKSSGQTYVSWDGDDRYGDQVDDDTYTYKITACNTYGCDTETGDVEVDSNGSSSSTPNITNDYATPNPFDPDTETTRIYFTLDKTADVTVEIWDGSTRVETIVDDVSKSSGQTYVTWDGDDRYNDQVDDDTYTYKITACNTYGCDTESGNVTVDSDSDNNNDDDLISNVHVNNAVFNPEDDERAQLCFDIENDDTEILVQVMDGNHVIETLINNVTYDETTDRCVYWDGRDDDNDIVGDDVYQFRIRAERGNDTQVEYAYTEVDTDGRIIGFPDDNDCGGFTDVDPNSPFCRAIALLNFRGVFTGYPDGTFRPYQVINRAETVKVNMLALDYDILSDDGSNLGFWDVQRGAWYMPYLRTAKRSGVINGYPDSSFRPNHSVNRVELLKIFLESTDINLPFCNVAPYPDTPVQYDTRWYMDYACFAKAFGLMRTDANGNFNPDAPMTRADVADLFYQFEMRGLFSEPNWNYYNSYFDTYNTNNFYSPTYPIYYY